ncbi:iron complex transport system permease protein [Kibdelosporangium banguiense]|uniref:Iron complex transport system permease protein n=1 Tax=Kibdelosporangium banguiense TaxID=1365924 RepID=A0ABS4TPV5_9PSEU|nr:iron chelate uptake ABC transporter family permease subunit [Kibdelosporangium banguiense]MBP2326434.1 iron complex transport system permease protein [Kibdelosporangium banguiense]
MVLPLVAAIAVLGLAAIGSLLVGAQPVGVGSALRVLFADDRSDAAVIVHDLRMPRTLLGVCTGIALGLAGALMQSLTRNPIADPGILGVNAGAALGVLVAVVGFGVAGFSGYVWFAFLGAMVSTALVYLIGTAGPPTTAPVRLVLAGTAVGAALVACTEGIIFLDPKAFDEYRFWIVGDVAKPDLTVTGQFAPLLAVGVVLALLLGPALNALALGDEIGGALGVRIARTRVLTGVAVLLLAGSATAAAGPIAFVGLVAPHLARPVTGADQRWLLPYSAVIGAIVVLLADILGRVVLPSGELRVSIMTAIVGAPFFVVLIRRKRATA